MHFIDIFICFLSLKICFQWESFKTKNWWKSSKTDESPPRSPHGKDDIWNIPNILKTLKYFGKFHKMLENIKIGPKIFFLKQNLNGFSIYKLKIPRVSIESESINFLAKFVSN